jgi:hypothetical protein
MSSSENRGRRPPQTPYPKTKSPKRSPNSKSKAARQPSSTLIRAGNNFLAPRRQP